MAKRSASIISKNYTAPEPDFCFFESGESSSSAVVGSAEVPAATFSLRFAPTRGCLAVRRECDDPASVSAGFGGEGMGRALRGLGLCLP